MQFVHKITLSVCGFDSVSLQGYMQGGKKGQKIRERKREKLRGVKKEKKVNCENGEKAS